jgi:hypothetical protein
VVLFTYDMHGMLQRNSPQCYSVRTVHHYEHFQLRKFCSEMCSSCEGQCRCTNYFLFFAAFDRGSIRAVGCLQPARQCVRTAILQRIDWCAPGEKRIKPPRKPKIVKVSSTDSAFVSCHKQFLLTLHVTGEITVS